MNEIPHSPEAERSVLGLCLLSDCFDQAKAILRAEDFFLDSHKRIFRAMSKLPDGGIDLITVAEQLSHTRELDAVGGRSYLASLVEGLPYRNSLDPLPLIVKEKSSLRQLIESASRAISDAAESETAVEVIERLESRLEAILDDSSHDSGAVKEFTVEALNKFEREKNLDHSPGHSFGLASLDEFTGGMRDGEVCVVGARSGVGKTSLMCQTAAANCSKGIGVHLFSLEMTRTQILQRLWSIVSGVPYVCIRDAWKADMYQSQNVRSAAAKVAEWPLRIHDNSELHLSKILALARISIRRHGTKIVAVDYAQEVEADGRDERARVMAVCRGLARMIKHEPASLMLLSQLVKVPYDRYNKPPVVGDLTESGKLENVAHVIVLLHRGFDENEGRISSDAEILVPKQRAGETGVLQCRFNRKTVVFE